MVDLADEQTEAQPCGMAPQEKDVVLAVHEDDRMQLKALVAKFKPTFTEKADKDLFMAIVGLNLATSALSCMRSSS